MSTSNSFQMTRRRLLQGALTAGAGLAFPRLSRARLAAIKEIQADPEKYYAFHAKASGYPLEVVKISHPISQFPEQAYPPEGLKLLNQVESFLLEQKLIRKPVDIAQWQVKGL